MIDARNIYTLPTITKKAKTMFQFVSRFSLDVSSQDNSLERRPVPDYNQNFKRIFSFTFQ
jgi:hypothetical protein